MPAKSGRGAKDVNKNYAAFVGKMTGHKTQAATAKVLVIGMTRAKELAPVEYNDLAGSAYHRVTKGANGVQGVGGFLAGITKDGFNYALKLHNTRNWSPRRPEDKEGPAWNPDASPFFLKRGFTDPDQKALMLRAIKTEMKI